MFLMFGGLLAGGAAAYLALGRPILTRWGATREELQRVWPGDDLTPDAKLISTHAITISAPPDAIWPWLVQIGNGRAGWYSFRFVERLVQDGKLLDETAPYRIVPQLQNLQCGDLIPAGDTAFRVVGLEPKRAMLLEPAFDVSMEGDGTRQRSATNRRTGFNFILEPIDAQTTRLVVRMRVTPSALTDWLYLLWFLEPGHAIMQTKMLHGIRARAERRLRVAAH